MIIADFITIKIVESLWVTNPLTSIEIMLIFIMHILLALYICINSYLLVKRRGNKFYEHEIYYAFFTYYTDIFSYFWIDLVELLLHNKKKKVVLKYDKGNK